jgi:hypothetical protein
LPEPPPPPPPPHLGSSDVRQLFGQLFVRSAMVSSLCAAMVSSLCALLAFFLGVWIGRGTGRTGLGRRLLGIADRLVGWGTELPEAHSPTRQDQNSHQHHQSISANAAERWLANGQLLRKRTVACQSQCTYTWKHAQPRFQVLGDKFTGTFSQWGPKLFDQCADGALAPMIYRNASGEFVETID